MTTYDKKRVVAGIVLAALVAAAANWHFELVFSRFAQLIMAVIVTIGVCLYPFRPTRRDFEEHSRKHNLGTSSRPNRVEPLSPRSFGDANVKYQGAVPHSSKFSEYYRGLADDELARIALEDHLVPEAHEALAVELRQRGLTDLSEYKKSPEEFPEALLARREPGASARARPEWAFVLGAWVIAAVLPIMFEVRGTRGSDSVTFLVVGGVYIAFSCYLGIKARRQGSKKGFVLKFIVPVVLVGLSTLFVALCNIFLGTAFWTAFY